MQALWQTHIADYRKQHLYRQRRVISEKKDTAIVCDNADLINFSSNDYLGMSQHPEAIKAFIRGAERFGVGGSSSQLVTGHLSIHREVELAFADFLQRDNALLFSCGYMANLGVISALTKACDFLWLDKQCHASLIDAAKLSGINWRRFQHKNYDQLETVIDKGNHPLLVTDGVFSMSGDMADLPRCTRICANLLVDDAHGIGVLGKNGGGVVEHFGLSQAQLPILVCPLGKAFGVMGAIVAGSDTLIDYLIQFARSYIYTHALPPALACAALQSLKIVSQENWRRDKLNALIRYFRQQAAKLDLPVADSETPIQTIILSDAKLAQQLSDHLLEQGILVSAMRPPAVAKHSTCLRVSLSCLHQEKQINYLLQRVKEAYEYLSSTSR